ncbi:MAG: methylated-DNA-protein-cysteine methyltransferase-like protein [Saprospiraceae bacterium]|jgi:methylated-DNA-protein-cysteine methyltransferase-like protein
MKEERTYRDDVFDVTRLIPAGRATTYGHLADYLALGSARMVGWALNKSYGAGYTIPAHRVVNRKGELSGRAHFSPPTLMQEKLEAEGIKVVDDKIVDFKSVLWIPADELHF